MDEIGINQLFGAAPEGVRITVHEGGDYIHFTVGAGFKAWVTNPLITDNGKSVGERNIEALHERLTEWILRNKIND